MSGGTSAGNIVTEVPATYGVRTWVNVTKADALGIISDAQLASIIGANWFNNADDNFKQLNQWFNGTGEADHIRAAEATVTTLNVTTLAVAEGAVEALVVGYGTIGDGAAGADDLVIGEIEATNRGLSILSTGVGTLAFVDTVATLTGYLAYTHATDTLAFGVGGATELNLTATALAPHVDGGLVLGGASLRYSAAHITAATLYSSATIGDATGSPILTFDKDTAGTGDILFRVESVTRWRLRHEADADLSLDRYTAAGAYVDSVTFDEATGLMTLPAGLTLAAGELTLSASDPVVTLGSGSGSGATLELAAATGYIRFSESSVTLWELSTDGGFNINRYVAGVFADAINVDSSTGVLTVPAFLTVGSDSAAAPTISVSKDTAGEGALAFHNEGTVRWAWVCDSSEDLLLRRFNSGGSLQNTCTFSQSTGLWTLTNDLTLSGARTLTVGSNSGAVSVVMSKADASAANIDFQSNATLRWRLACNSSENLILERYNSSAVLQDTLTVSNSNGEWSFPAPIGLNGSASRLRMGTGAPAGATGNNGDYYFRTDGGTSTCIYFKTGGSWTALAT